MTSVLSSLPRSWKCWMTPEILEVLDDAADFVVAVGGVGGEDLDLADEQLLLVGAELVPGLQHFIGPGRQLRILGNQAELLLVGEDRFAQLLVAAVKQLHRADLVHPLLGRVVRRVRRARRVLDEDRLVGLRLVDARHVVDGIVGHAGDQWHRRPCR